MRINGFYWVKLHVIWMIAEWHDGYWFLTNIKHTYKDSDFELIIELPLTPPVK